MARKSSKQRRKAKLRKKAASRAKRAAALPAPQQPVGWVVQILRGSWHSENTDLPVVAQKQGFESNFDGQDWMGDGQTEGTINKIMDEADPDRKCSWEQSLQFLPYGALCFNFEAMTSGFPEFSVLIFHKELRDLEAWLALVEQRDKADSRARWLGSVAETVYRAVRDERFDDALWLTLNRDPALPDSRPTLFELGRIIDPLLRELQQAEADASEAIRKLHHPGTPRAR